MASSLVSTQTRVESPFIIVKIGQYTFGHCSDMSNRARLRQTMKVVFPNYMQSLNIVKVNGAVNTYTLRMDYAITEVDDPNMLEKVFSSVSKTRKIVLSYGDWNAPAFIYKEEEAIITKVASSVDFRNSKITYTVSCVSTALSLQAGTRDFPARTAKPSDIIFQLLSDESSGLTSIFTGMKNSTKVALDKLIARDDKVVRLDKQTMNTLEYIGYLVSCMVCQNEGSGKLKKSNYFWAVYDDTSNDYGGTYFKVTRVSAEMQYNVSYDCYEVDVGYPSGSYVSSFTVNSDDTWSILYDYSESVQLPQYSYSIDRKGNIVSIDAPAITKSNKYKRTTEPSKTWWSQMTQFPITAKLTIKGLLRPALLMTYVKVNTYFYGHKHVSSGLYIITRQEDTIDSNGYQTTLSLTRISGDTDRV